MKLVMYINEKPVDSIPVDLKLARNQELLLSLVQHLKEKHFDLISHTMEEVVFCLEGVMSKMNERG